MSKAAPFISARVIDFHVWVAVMARLRGKMDSESVIPQSICPLSRRLLDIIQTGSGGNRQRCNRGRAGQGRPEGRAVFRPTHKSRYAAGICDKCA